MTRTALEEFDATRDMIGAAVEHAKQLEAAYRTLKAGLPEGPTHFGPFSVELEAAYDSADPGRGAWVDCWISTPDGSDTGSLAMLEGEGAFMNGDDAPSERLMDRIRAFAEKHGY